jgi:serine/threonine-protein kinase RsbW
MKHMAAPRISKPSECPAAASKPSAPRAVRLNINSDPATLAPARHAVEELALCGGFDAVACGEIALCVNEAIANIIRHAYEGATDMPIELSAELKDDAIHIRIRDWGNGVNPESLPPKPRDPLTPGGLGLICLRSMMDRTVFTPQPDGMLLEMSRSSSRKEAPRR